MMRAEMNDLLAVLEDIRSEKYPEIPKELIEKIAIEQFENQDNRALARANTIKAIAEYLNSISGEEG